MPVWPNELEPRAKRLERFCVDEPDTVRGVGRMIADARRVSQLKSDPYSIEYYLTEAEVHAGLMTVKERQDIIATYGSVQAGGWRLLGPWGWGARGWDTFIRAD